MCTVSFYRDQDNVIITSNRDERSERPLALHPQKYIHESNTLYYPKDPQAGGSWFVVNGNGCIYVLLNGAAHKHTSTPPYSKSRGLILLELAREAFIHETWKAIDLQDVEPFTLVVYDHTSLIQLRWNGIRKDWTNKPVHQPHIWSSSTLYSPDMVEKREQWFAEFLRNKAGKIEAPDLLDFHTKTQQENLDHGLLINRDQKMLTKNITQFVLENNHMSLLHSDLVTKTSTQLRIENETVVA